MASFDQYEENRFRDVFPKDWKNPQSSGVYDLVVIGGGPGGMTAAKTAIGLGAKVAIIEKEHFGGECLNVGCIPSKAFLRSSRLVAEVRGAFAFGIEINQGWKVDFSAVMQRVRKMQSTISPHDSVARFKNMGCDVFLGTGRFIDCERLEVGGQILQFKKAVIATGTQPIRLEVPGLEEVGYLTNQNVFNLTTLPSKMAIIGGGPIACELAQGFARFGTQVVMITRGAKILTKDDPEASLRLQKVLEKEGIELIFNEQLVRVEQKGKEKSLYLKENSKSIDVEEILVAVGRVPTVEGLDLEKANVSFDFKNGIETNEFLETSNSNIYAIGDVTSRFKFTHISVELGKMAVENALLGCKEKKSSLVIPWCTYTDPEIAHVARGNRADTLTETITIEMKDVDRAILDGETVGFVKIHLEVGSDQIAGATIMAKHAGDMISEIAVAMVSKIGIKELMQTIHSFPTQSAGVRAAAQAFIEQREQMVKQSVKKVS